MSSSDRIHEVLSASTEDRRKHLAVRAGASVDDVVKARKLLKAITTIVASGDSSAWRRLAVAYDVVDVSGFVEDDEPPYDGPADATMPTAQALVHAVKDEAPLSSSVDETVMLSDTPMNFDDPPPPDRNSASAPAGSTLMEGGMPAYGSFSSYPSQSSVSSASGSSQVSSFYPSSHIQATPGQQHGPAANTPNSGAQPVSPRQLSTVQLPIHMPGPVTASSAAVAAQAPVSSRPVGTTPMESVPSAVLDIEKYAVLCAWTEVNPTRRDQLHEQYGLENEDARRQLDQRFESLFSTNAAMRAAFQKRLELHIRFLRR